MTKEQVWEAYTSALFFITEGSQDRNTRQEIPEAGSDLLTRLFSLTCSAYLLIKSRRSTQRMAPPTMGCPPPPIDRLMTKCLRAGSQGGISSAVALS